MYTKEDYKSYVNQMMDIEIKMKNNIAFLIPFIKNERAKEILERIYTDENDHKDSLDIVLKIIDEL
jgi:hypothetical protein